MDDFQHIFPIFIAPLLAIFYLTRPKYPFVVNGSNLPTVILTFSKCFDIYLYVVLCQLELDINPRFSSEYINYLDNPIEVVNEAEKAAVKDTWSLVQFTVDLRRQYGKEPYAMEVLLKKLYVKRMAADIGITRIYVSGKTVVMMTNMSEQVFKMIRDAMLSDIHRNMLAFHGDEIKVQNTSVFFLGAVCFCEKICKPFMFH